MLSSRGCIWVCWWAFPACSSALSRSKIQLGRKVSLFSTACWALKMLVKGSFPCFISLLGHLGVSRAGCRACDACCPWCAAAQSQSKAGTGVPQSHHGRIRLTARLCQCSKNGMSLGAAPAGDGQPASSTWLGQRDMSLARTSVVAFHVQLCLGSTTHVSPVDGLLLQKEITVRVSGQKV